MFNLSGVEPTARSKMKVLKCSNSSFDMAMMIDTGNDEFYVSGKKIEAENIKTFNDMAIEAQWSHSGGRTEIFLDRVTGKARILEFKDGVMPNPDVPSAEDELDCQYTGTEF
tara:strand:- start:674 stop:1009 length:336 start_codon:yes stop_codon:yes gene_type:complete